MTDEREKADMDPAVGPSANGEGGASRVPESVESDPGYATLRSIPVAAAAEEFADPDAPVYVEAAPLVAVSKHKTLEIQTIKLASEIDPRKQATQVRLRKAGVGAPAVESGWPAQTGLSSSKPAFAPGRRWRTPLIILILLSTALLVVVARLVVWRAKPMGDSFTASSASEPASSTLSALAAAPARPVPGARDEASVGVAMRTPATAIDSGLGDENAARASKEATARASGHTTARATLPPDPPSTPRPARAEPVKPTPETTTHESAPAAPPSAPKRAIY